MSDGSGFEQVYVRRGKVKKSSGGTLGLLMHDTGLEVTPAPAYPFLGDELSGFHWVPRENAQVAVLQEVTGYPTGTVSVTDTASKLPAHTQGEGGIFHSNGNYLCYMFNSGQIQLLHSVGTAGTQAIQINPNSATDSIDISPGNSGTVNFTTGAVAITRSLTLGGTVSVNGAGTSTFAGPVDFRSWVKLSTSHTPTLSAGTTMGTGGSINQTLTEGGDYAGKVTIVTGHTIATTTGQLVNIAFSGSGAMPDTNYRLLLTPANAAAAALQLYEGTLATGNFNVNNAIATAIDTTYVFNYLVIR